jgi:hypothetical protein
LNEKITFNNKKKFTMTTATVRTSEPRKFVEQRFEFILYINNHIICQRYFDIRDFNDKSINSIEIGELMDAICGMDNGDFGTMGIIPNYLKKKSKEYLWSMYNPYAEPFEQPYKDNFEKLDNFQFEIKIDKQTVGFQTFNGNNFPTKVRYAVDIKEIIPAIMAEIRLYLSRNKYTKSMA